MVLPPGLERIEGLQGDGVLPAQQGDAVSEFPGGRDLKRADAGCVFIAGAGGVDLQEEGQPARQDQGQKKGNPKEARISV